MKIEKKECWSRGDVKMDSKKKREKIISLHHQATGGFFIPIFSLL